jgi:molybdate/tungstate transport system substrate-binding protein
MRPSRRLSPAVVFAATLAALAAIAAPAATVAAPVGAATPTVSVLYAGSLARLNDQVLGPAFTRATGIAYSGHGGGSLGLAQEIAAGELGGDIFESVGTTALAKVGRRTLPWAVAIASQPLVVAYNPHSRYAAAFRAIAAGRRPLRDLFTLLATPGLRLGRTNPATDPQGQAFVLMVELATREFHLPKDTPTRILGPLVTSPEVYAETALPAELQAGALDAASAFLPEALDMHQPFIALPPTLDFATMADAAVYASVWFTLPGTRTAVRGAPLAIWGAPLYGPGHASALGIRYLEFLLSPQGQALWRREGYTTVAPSVYGDARRVPAAVRRELRGPTA